MNADAKMAAVAQAFIEHAAKSRCFKYVGQATPENLSRLDLLIELTVSYEHEGSGNVHYCLGRLIANVYNADHSQFLHRFVKFHEAMYTPGKRDHAFAHDGGDVQAALQRALFDELIGSLAAPASGG